MGSMLDFKPTSEAKIGIIGGTGIYDPKLLEDAQKIRISTPFGAPSDEITIGKLAGRGVAFINRHGPGHSIPPHLVNSQANIWALKKLGVKRIIAPGAVGPVLSVCSTSFGTITGRVRSGAAPFASYAAAINSTAAFDLSQISCKSVGVTNL